MPEIHLEASFQCPTSGCGTTIGGYIAVVPQSDFLNAHTPEITSEEAMICERCKTTHQVQVTSMIDGHRAALIGSPSTTVYIGGDAFSRIDWDEYEPPFEPIRILRDAQAELTDIWKDAGKQRYGNTPLGRMVFVQHFSILEAFLSDSLIGLARRDDEVALKLLTEVAELKDARVTIRDAFLDPDIARARLDVYLRSLQFHNFPKVEKIFEIAVNQRIMPKEPNERQQLFDWVNTRHDCVHRNGVDHEGVSHDDYHDIIPKLQRAFLKIAESINRAVETRDLERARLAEEAERRAATRANPRDDDDYPF